MESIFSENKITSNAALSPDFSSGMRMLVSGDSRSTVESLRTHFLRKRCEVEVAYASSEIQKKLVGKTFDVFVGGFLSSDEYALRIIQIVRSVSAIRMLFLTKKNDPAFNVRALDCGADDCLASPTSFLELDARILCLCRRNESLRFRETKIALHKKDEIVEIDLVRRSVKKNGRSVFLTKTEYRILFHLAIKQKELVFYEELEAMLRDEHGDRHTVNTHVFNLRKKLGSALAIKTLSCRGVVLF